MEKLERYRSLVKDYLCKVVELCERRPTPGVEHLCVFDEPRDVYLVMSTGWDRNRRARTTILFVRIKNGKIWIEQDGTEYGIGNELLRAGVPKSDIVLGFHHPEDRRQTEFAVA